MTSLLIPTIVVLALMVMVVVSLVRGIAAFLRSTRDDLERGEGEGPSPSQIQQNRMMSARIKYQALAVIVIAILLASVKH